MANETRIRANFVSGTLESTIGTGSTVITSTGLVNLPGVSSTEHAAITLDTNATGGASEIAYVTAHTTGANTATIGSRGQEGTSARAHASGASWEHAPSVRDFGAGRVAFTEKSTGDSSVTATSFSSIADLSDISVRAAAGDVCEIGINSRWLASAAFGLLNVSVVTASTVLGPIYGTGTGSVPSWAGDNSDTAPQHNVGGPFYHAVGSSELNSGSVTFRLMAKRSGGTSRTLKSSTDQPLQFWAKNHGPPFSS